MRFILATEDGGTPLLLSSPERAESGAKRLDLPSVLRPVARTLRGDRAVVVGLSLLRQSADRA